MGRVWTVRPLRSSIHWAAGHGDEGMPGFFEAYRTCLSFPSHESGRRPGCLVSREDLRVCEVEIESRVFERQVLYQTEKLSLASDFWMGGARGRELIRGGIAVVDDAVQIVRDHAFVQDRASHIVECLSELAIYLL